MTDAGIILVVDDEPLILELVSAILEELRHGVVAVGNSRDALAVVRERAPELRLLISDVTMPDMNGDELADAVTELCEDVAVLLMSGQPGDRQLAEQRDNWDFIKKPFSVTDLLSKVEKMLGAP